MASIIMMWIWGTTAIIFREIITEFRNERTLNLHMSKKYQKDSVNSSGYPLSNIGPEYNYKQLHLNY